MYSIRFVNQRPLELSIDYTLQSFTSNPHHLELNKGIKNYLWTEEEEIPQENTANQRRQ